MTALRITLLYGSYREGRQGIKAVKHLQKALEAQGAIVTFVDAMAYDFPILKKRYIDYDDGTAPQAMEEIHDLLQHKTDAVVIVSGEYNGTMQPGLMNLMDHFYTEFFHKPVGLVTYSMGALGGARVSMHLLTTLCVFGMSPIPTIFGIGTIQNKLDEDGKSLDESLTKKSNKFIKELKWYGNAFKAAHENGSP